MQRKKYDEIQMSPDCFKLIGERFFILFWGICRAPVSEEHLFTFSSVLLLSKSMKQKFGGKWKGNFQALKMNFLQIKRFFQ